MSFRRIFRRVLDRPEDQAQDERAILAEGFLRRLDRLTLNTARYLRGSGQGERISRRRFPSSDFLQHRAYAHGDDLRFVDWNAFARSDHVFVKLGERPQEVSVHLLLDCSRSMEWGTPRSKRVAMQRLATCLGYIALAHGDRLSISPIADRPIPPFGPTQGKSRLPAMLRYLGELPVERYAPIQPVLIKYATSNQYGGAVILMSDLLHADGLADALRAFRPPLWQVLVVQVLHTAELNPILRGDLELEDAETGERANFDIDADVLRRYRKQVAEWCERIEHACFEGGADFVRVLADQSLGTSVLPLLRQRRILVRR